LLINIPLHILRSKQQSTATDTRRNQVAVRDDPVECAHTDPQTLRNLIFREKL
jgi:hypothetical protein